MIESEVIINKLKSEGIDENLSKGVNFETEEALNEWVSAAKTFATKPKSIEEYTKEEIAAILKDPQPKAKGLQGYVDSLRSKEPKVDVPPVNNPQLEIPAEIKEKLAKVDELLSGQKTAMFDAMVKNATLGLDEYEVNLIKASIPKDADATVVNKMVGEYKQAMARKGLKGYTTQEASAKGDKVDLETKSSVQRILERKNKK